MLFHEIPWFIQELPNQTYVEPVSIDELKVQCRVDSDDENPWLTTAGIAARELLEVDTRRAFISRQFKLVADQFPYWGQLDRQSIERTSQAVGVFYGGGILLRRCPVVSLDLFQYIDTTGTLTTLPSDGSAYLTDFVSEPARVYPAYGIPWPITRWQNNALQMTFTAGFGAAATSTPARAKAAIKLLVGHWFYHRESVGVVGDEIALGYWSAVKSLRWSASPL